MTALNLTCMGDRSKPRNIHNVRIEPETECFELKDEAQETENERSAATPCIHSYNETPLSRKELIEVEKML